MEKIDYNHHLISGHNSASSAQVSRLSYSRALAPHKLTYLIPILLLIYLSVLFFLLRIASLIRFSVIFLVFLKCNQGQRVHFFNIFSFPGYFINLFPTGRGILIFDAGQACQFAFD